MKKIFGLMGLIFLTSCGSDSGTSNVGEKKKVVFFSESAVNGDLSALSGTGSPVQKADSLCNADSKKPAGGGNFKAMLSSSDRRACSSPDCLVDGRDEHIDWIFKPETSYYNTDGKELFITNSLSLVDTDLSEDLGGEFTVTFSSTGINSDWTVAGDTCSNWTSSEAVDSGRRGGMWEVGVNWYSGYVYSCNQYFRIVCVEQ